MGGAAVLVVQVVGVLPDVEGEEGLEAAGEGVAGARLLGDLQGAVGGGGKPHPAAAEKARALGFEVCLEGVKGAPLGDDLGGEILRFAQNDIVAWNDTFFVILRLAEGSFADYLLKGEAFKSAAWKQFVQVVDIGLQVFSVMERQGLGTDKRFKRIGCVRKFYKCEHIMSV